MQATSLLPRFHRPPQTCHQPVQDGCQGCRAQLQQRHTAHHASERRGVGEFQDVHAAGKAVEDRPAFVFSNIRSRMAAGRGDSACLL